MLEFKKVTEDLENSQSLRSDELSKLSLHCLNFMLYVHTVKIEKILKNH